MVVKNDAQFEAAFEVWTANQEKVSSGERKRRLLSEMNHAQKQFLVKVWWPIFHSFNGLMAEFEVRDFKDGYRYLDFAWFLAGGQIAIEIDGFGPHWRNADRWQFADHLQRQNHLIFDDWIVIRFSYDDIMEHPRRCQQLLMQTKGKWSLEKPTNQSLKNPLDRAIMDYAARRNAPFTPSQAAEDLGWHRVTITRRTLNLARAGLLTSTSPGKSRFTQYIFNKAALC
ncbi:helix-turn-helix domain-containing protein [Cohnella abietis]|uniref:DUF559 domain-containing protein n=1 Tax=Cohnella abietis TaxID=2507935 RepID=A0A3T1D1Z9_9BACL|nr:DNA-binding response regulator [Cohnella abietis]BBI32137.1 hypothetical protein KCTCHS21_15360 [Cohnella abietis]